MKKYIVFYMDSAESIIANSPGEAKRIATEKNIEIALEARLSVIKGVTPSIIAETRRSIEKTESYLVVRSVRPA